MFKLEKVSNKKIEKKIRKLLCKYPEVTEAQIKTELDDYAKFYNKYPVSENRIRKYLYTMDCKDLSWDRRYPAVKLSSDDDFKEAIKSMPILHRMDYAKGIIRKIQGLQFELHFLFTQLDRVEMVNSILTAKEFKAARKVLGYGSDFTHTTQMIRESLKK